MNRLLPYRLAAGLGALLLAGSSLAETLRVGTSGDYAPFSVVSEETTTTYRGLAPALARAFAEDRDLQIEFVRFRWSELLTDLKNDRFDVAMGGITIRPERSIAGRFTVPVTTSGAVVLIPKASPFVTTRDLDRTDLQIAVNSGGHLEHVTRSHFLRARIRTMDHNRDVIRSLADGEVDAAVSDTREAIIWQQEHPDLRAVGPFTRDRKALLVTARRRDLARDLDAWLLSAQADGQLDRLRETELSEIPGTTPVTEPLSALLAALDERLALMRWVAEAKRQRGAPVEAPEVETRVLEAAVADVRAAEGRNPVAWTRNEDDIRRFFRAQIEAAKTVQRRTLAEAPDRTGPKTPDLETELRPALLRIGDRISTLLAALPSNLGAARIREVARRELTSPNLQQEDRAAITQALIELA